MNSAFAHQLRSPLFRTILGILCLWIAPPPLLSQGEDLGNSDSTNTADAAVAPPAPPARSGQVEGPVKYWAEHISFSIPDQITRLEGKVRIDYQDVTLKAGKVFIDWKKNLMTAEGLPDSTDSLGKAIYTDLPILTEKGTEPITGFTLEYNFKEQRGKVVEAKTRMDPGYYRGKDVRKIGQETLLIEKGYFTTCDLEHPHYYFGSSKMRVRVKKEAVAKPVILYIADVPVMAIPFGVFSLKRGRRSGIIIPTIGQNNTQGRNLRDFGYYWAASDYWDATFLGSFFEKTGFLFTANARYRKRYLLSGNVEANYAPKDVLTGEKKERWELAFKHDQKIGQTLSIVADGRFVSDKNFRQDYYTDIDDRLEQTLTTNFFIRKTLPGSRSLAFNLQRSENLQTDREDLVFPDITFSQPSRNLIPLGSGETSWYHNIKYSYDTALRSTFSRIPLETDSLGETTRFDESRKSGWRHNLRTSFNEKFLKYFKFNHSINFQELWVPDYLEYSFVDSLNTAVADTVSGFRARHTFSTSINTSTTMYGLWEIPFSPLKVIRHKMDPVIGFSYTPDFSEEAFGYFQTFQDTTGRVRKFDRFQNNPFGGTSRGESRSLTMALNNLFQGKVFNKEGEEKKIDLFRLNFSTAYNFAADSLRLRNLSTNLNARPNDNLGISLNATHSFYKKKSNGSGRKDELVWADGFQLPDLINWGVTINAGFQLHPPKKKEEAALQDTLAGEFGRENDFNSSINIEKLTYEERAFQGFDIPWNVDVRFTYSYSENEFRFITKHFDANLTARLQLTRNWKINYNARLDILNREIDSQTFTVNRDLHCWTMNLTWSPNPAFSFFRFEIRIKENILRDLKLTKTAGRRPFF